MRLPFVKPLSYRSSLRYENTRLGDDCNSKWRKCRYNLAIDLYMKGTNMLNTKGRAARFKLSTREASTSKAREWLQGFTGKLEGWKFFVDETRRNPKGYSVKNLQQLLRRYVRDVAGIRSSQRVEYELLAIFCRLDAGIKEPAFEVTGMGFNILRLCHKGVKEIYSIDERQYELALRMLSAGLIAYDHNARRWSTPEKLQERRPIAEKLGKAKRKEQLK